MTKWSSPTLPTQPSSSTSNRGKDSSSVRLKRQTMGPGNNDHRSTRSVRRNYKRWWLSEDDYQVDGSFKDWLSSRPAALRSIYWEISSDASTNFKMGYEAEIKKVIFGMRRYEKVDYFVRGDRGALSQIQHSPPRVVNVMRSLESVGLKKRKRVDTLYKPDCRHIHTHSRIHTFQTRRTTANGPATALDLKTKSFTRTGANLQQSSTGSSPGGVIK